MSKNKKGLILSIIGILGLIVITVGVTYAFFNYVKEGTTENSITSGTITFLYTEVSEVGRGISIEDAYPMSDEIGKVQVGEGKIFDFKITSNTSNSTSIPYEVTARKKSTSTLDESAVKLYLTEVDGSIEEEILLDNYSNLVQTTRVDSSRYIEKTIYEGKVPVNSINYEKNFRLRMWIDDSADFGPIKGENGEDIYPYNGKEFTITINVYANGKVVTEEEKALEESIPTFNSQNYPLLTEYGVMYGISINYSEESIQKLYRVNKGKWQNYENIPIELKSYDILEAKSVFVQGIESNIADYKITEDSLSTLPPDALGPIAYDGNLGTYDGFSDSNGANGTYEYWDGKKRINVETGDNSLVINVYYTKHDFGALDFTYYDSSNQKISSITLDNSMGKLGRQSIIIPENTSYIIIDMSHWIPIGMFASNCIYELEVDNIPKLTETALYPTFTKDSKIGIYNEVMKVNYFKTSIEKLYRINEGEWKQYQYGSVYAKLGDKFEAKGIDKYGKETPVLSYTVVLAPDALGPIAYDGDFGTYDGFSNSNGANGTYEYWNGKKRIDVETRNTPLVVNVYYTKHDFGALGFTYYDSSNQKISSITLENSLSRLGKQSITIPENTAYIIIDMSHWTSTATFASNCIYELEIVNPSEVS